MSKLSWSRLLAVVVVILPLLAGCAPQAPQSQTSMSRTLNVGLFGDADFIDPHLANSLGFVPIENSYESLVYTDRDTTNLAPQLAESWTASPDGLRFTFKIRQGVKFQDGADLDAEAVRTSMERLRTINKGPAFVLTSVNAITVTDK